LRLCAVGERHVTAQREGCRQQSLVELEHLGPVIQRRLLGRPRGVDPEIAGRPVEGDLPRVDLPLNAELDQVPRPSRGAERAVRRIDAADAGHDEVRAREIEQAREHQRGHRRRRVAVPHAGRDDADVGPVAVHGRVVRRQARHRDVSPRADMIQPHLPLRTEHRDDDHLHRPALTVHVQVARADAREAPGNQQGSQKCTVHQAIRHPSHSCDVELIQPIEVGRAAIGVTHWSEHGTTIQDVNGMWASRRRGPEARNR